MHRAIPWVLGGLAMTALLGGCATTPGECDPTARDFFKNTSCLASGSYAQRERDMQVTLAQERSRNESFRALLDELRAEEAQVKGQVKARQAESARLDRAWGKLKQDLRAASAGGGGGALDSRIAGIDRDVQDLKKAEARGDDAAKSALRDNLKRRVSLLEKELEAGTLD
jgi:hypothetical protein